MTSKADAYKDASVSIHGLYQRFQYGFGGYIEVLMTLLEKQHWQAAADIMPLISREKVGFEGVLLGMQAELAEKGFKEDNGTGTEESNGAGPFSSEAADPGEAAA